LQCRAGGLALTTNSREAVRAVLGTNCENRQYNFLPFGENVFDGVLARPTSHLQ